MKSLILSMRSARTEEHRDVKEVCQRDMQARPSTEDAGNPAKTWGKTFQPQETACEEMERTLSGLRSSAITSPKLLLLLPAPRGMTLPLQPPLGLNQTTSARCYHPRLWFLYPSVKFLSEFTALGPGTGGTPSVSDELMNELKKVEPLMVINAAYIHHLRIHVHWASARLAPRQPRTRSGEEP